MGRAGALAATSPRVVSKVPHDLSRCPLKAESKLFRAWRIKEVQRELGFSAGTEVGDPCYNVPPSPWTVVCVILGYFSTGVSCLTLIKGQPARVEEEKEELEGQKTKTRAPGERPQWGPHSG